MFSRILNDVLIQKTDQHTCVQAAVQHVVLCITLRLSSSYVLVDKEAEQTIAHALITKDEFLLLSLPVASPPPSVCLCRFPFMAVFPASSRDLLSRREKTQTEH